MNWVNQVTFGHAYLSKKAAENGTHFLIRDKDGPVPYVIRVLPRKKKAKVKK